MRRSRVGTPSYPLRSYKWSGRFLPHVATSSRFPSPSSSASWTGSTGFLIVVFWFSFCSFHSWIEKFHSYVTYIAYRDVKDCARDDGIPDPTLYCSIFPMIAVRSSLDPHLHRVPPLLSYNNHHSLFLPSSVSHSFILGIKIFVFYPSPTAAKLLLSLGIPNARQGRHLLNDNNKSFSFRNSQWMENESVDEWTNVWTINFLTWLTIIWLPLRRLFLLSSLLIQPSRPEVSKENLFSLKVLRSQWRGFCPKPGWASERPEKKGWFRDKRTEPLAHRLFPKCTFFPAPDRSYHQFEGSHTSWSSPIA